jgi:multicomponent K+:H+ antiporter subunit D
VSGWAAQLIIAPVVLPLVAGAVMVLAGDRRRGFAGWLGLASAAVLLAIAVVLLGMADDGIARVYRVGDWPSAFGIVLVLDRLSAMMLVLSAALGLCALLHAGTRRDSPGAYFQPLFQFQLMGLNGAFLTGDLFNLFVFVEVMLAASYGLALHGSGTARVRAGLHYVAVNLVASLLFLVGTSTIYGLAGTLNMADLATRIPALAPEDRGLFEAGAAILGVAFLVKAAMWPLGFWLAPTYAAASPPAAAILSILSKVGIYIVLRLWLLLFGEGAGASAGFGGTWLIAGGLLTVAFGSIAVLATQNTARLAGACVIVSSGTLLAAVGAGQAAVTGGVLFYLASAVPAIAAFFLVVDIVERGRGLGADVLAVTREAFGEAEEEGMDEVEVGVAIPAATAALGLGFAACALVLAGLPPLSGFLAKFAILAPVLGERGGAVAPGGWLLLGAMLVSGLATVIAMTRSGIEAFWAAPDGMVLRVGVLEFMPVAALLGMCLALTVAAGPAMRFMQDAADALHRPVAYIQGVQADRGGAP